MLVGGFEGKIPEVVYFENSTTYIPEFEELQHHRIRSFGGLISGTMIVCGHRAHTKSCITYKDQQWTETHTMTTEVEFILKLTLLKFTIFFHYQHLNFEIPILLVKGHTE